MPDLFLCGPVLPPYEHSAEATATICDDRLNIWSGNIMGHVPLDIMNWGVQSSEAVQTFCTLELVTLMMIKETSERHGLR